MTREPLPAEQDSHFEIENHPVGELSRQGVLDVGLKCTHSCTFCYYSFWDGSDDQFQGMRKAPWRTKEELKETLRRFREWGLERLDVTGGEPTLHPDLPELMAYSRDLGLQPRIITLGQFLTRSLRRSPNLLIDDLLQAGVRQYLFSIHAVEEELFHRITGESFQKLDDAVQAARQRELFICANTVVHRHNAFHLVDIARYLAQHEIRIANFIVMKVEFSWSNQRDLAVATKALYSDLYPQLRRATEILEKAGVGVNIRYGPFCAYPGLEKNLVGFKGVQLDPYEWRNGLRGGAGEGPYGQPPFLFFEDLASYQREHPKAVESDAEYNMTFAEPCRQCALRPICDGVDQNYLQEHGDSELKPYDGEIIEDLVHFRRRNPAVFRMLAAKPRSKDQ